MDRIEQRILANTVRPYLEAFACKHAVTVHLGIWEDEMVTYLVKAERAAQPVFTIEGTQLEADCSAIGRVLLALLPEPEFEQYLAGSELVAFTDKTCTDRDELRAIIATSRETRFATEYEEVESGLSCVAVPLQLGRHFPTAGLSLSAYDALPAALSRLPELQNQAVEIERYINDLVDQ